MKYLIILFGMFFSISSFANESLINEQNLIGQWSCSTAFQIDKLDIVEVSSISFQANGSSTQVGVGYYKDIADRAKLEYNISSSWSLNDNILKFYKAKMNQHFFNNPIFNKKYHITEQLLKSIDEEHDYEVLNLTDTLLVIRPIGYDLTEVCRKL